jgi:hypothetical protein
MERPTQSSRISNAHQCERTVSIANRAKRFKLHHEVGVGIIIAHNSLHGSGQAGFPRPALALGEDPDAAQGVGMTDGRQRQPASAVSADVHGVSDRAGLRNPSRYRRSRWGLPLLLAASASRSEFLTRLNTRPARSPVNASTPPLRAAPHDSGPMWVANSHSYDFCIHYTSPV